MGLPAWQNQGAMITLGYLHCNYTFSTVHMDTSRVNAIHAMHPNKQPTSPQTCQIALEFVYHFFFFILYH